MRTVACGIHEALYSLCYSNSHSSFHISEPPEHANMLPHLDAHLAQLLYLYTIMITHGDQLYLAYYTWL